MTKIISSGSYTTCPIPRGPRNRSRLRGQRHLQVQTSLHELLGCQGFHASFIALCPFKLSFDMNLHIHMLAYLYIHVHIYSYAYVYMYTCTLYYLLHGIHL